MGWLSDSITRLLQQKPDTALGLSDRLNGHHYRVILRALHQKEARGEVRRSGASRTPRGGGKGSYIWHVVV